MAAKYQDGYQQNVNHIFCKGCDISKYKQYICKNLPTIFTCLLYTIDPITNYNNLTYLTSLLTFVTLNM